MPKRAPPLTAKALAGVRCTNMPIELVDGYVPGLRVRVLPTGTKSWSLNIRDSKGTRRRYNIGTGLPLAEARRKAERVRQAVHEGADPTNERRVTRLRAQAAKAGIDTLDGLLEAYFVSGPGSRQRRSQQGLQLARAVFRPVFGMPRLEIERAELQLIADRWTSTSSAARAVRILRPSLKWAERRGLVPAGVSNLEQPAPDGQCARVVTREELKAIWPFLRGAHGSVIRWLLRTGCRLNEAAGMTWGEINGDLWTLPAARSKNGRERLVPLPTQAIELLSATKGVADEGQDANALVFPSQGGNRLSNWELGPRNEALTSAVWDLGMAPARPAANRGNNARRPGLPTTCDQHSPWQCSHR
jgi:integrase